MINEYEGVVRQSQNSRNVFCGGFEWPGANDYCRLAVLLEADAVMQTARGTASSVTDRRDQEITGFTESL